MEANLAALRLLTELRAADRPATADEQAVLARWSGWGAVPQVFDEHLDTYANARAELRELLTKDGFDAANRTVLNAHYTDGALVHVIWDALQQVGFTEGDVLEPGCGSGHFIGLAPPGARMVGVERDPTSAGIARLLYPHAHVVAGPFEDLDAAEGSFDAAIGNVPFGDFWVHDPRHNPARHTLHNHFLIKALHLTRPGGLVIALTSRYTLDARNPAARREMAQLADLLGAVRLPTNAHRRAAGTQVVTDLLILRRRESGRSPTDAQSWEWAQPRTIAGADDGTTMLINQYFDEHPEQVLGELRAKFVPGRGMDLEVLGDREVGPALAEALQPIVAHAVERGYGLTPPVGPRTPRPASEIELIDPDAALFAGFLTARPDGTFTRRVSNHDQPYTPPPAQADELRQILGIRDLAMALVTAEDRSVDDTPEIQARRGELNTAYDAYVATYGPPSRYTQSRTMLAGWGVFKRWCADNFHEPLPAAPDTVRAYLTHLREAGVGADILTRHLDGIVKAHQTAHDKLVEQVLDLIEGAQDASARERAALIAAEQPDRFLFATGTADVRLNPAAEHAGREVVASADASTPAEVDLDELGLRTTTIKRPPQGGFRDDPFAGVVRALEVFDPATQTARKEDIFTQRVINPPRPQLGAETADEALSICLDTHSRVDLAEIARLLGCTDTAEARAELGELVFDDPDTDELVWAPLYLSGNVRRKLDRAREAAHTDPRFAVNAAALERVVPPDLGPSDVVVQLGAWVEPHYVEQFLRELVQDHKVRVEHPLPALWVVSEQQGTYPATNVWGSPDLDAYQLTELLLSGEEIRVTRTVEYVKSDGSIGERQVLDVEATELARDKAAAIGDRFSAWVWEDTERAQALLRRYNDLFNSEIPTDFATAQLSTPGLATAITLREHQIAAVTRMIYQDGIGLIHDVGAGKTLEIIVGVMERHRRGLSSKAIVVVRNDSIAEQFERQWRSAYPSAQVLTATSDDFTVKGGRDKRAEFVGRITTGSWDAIIITKDAFQRIPLSADTQRAYIQRELDDIRELRRKKHSDLTETAAKKTQRVLAAAEERLSARLDAVPRDSKGVSFEQSGIDLIVWDEAQDVKNGLVISNLPDLGIPGSDRAIDFDLKLQWLAERHGRCCAVLATATPFTGKFSEVYLWLRRLGRDLGPFDEWAHNFIVAETFTEYTPSGALRPKIRMRRMINEDDLWNLLRLTSDVRMADALTIPGLPRLRDDKVEIITVSAPVEARIHSMELGRRERDLRNNPRRPTKGADNHLVINHHGMQAALDLRIRSISTEAPQKVDVIADDIYREHQAAADNVYRATDGSEHPIRGGLILVFCDESIPRPGWNFYQELKDQLVARGIAEDSIRFIHEANTAQAKQDLFTACRNGGVSVLIGSTQRMGAGLNVQDRLIGGYEIIPPRDYRADTSHQARGRVIRQGNQNETVFWKRAVLAPSLDAKKWEIVRQKHDLFAPLLAANPPGRHRDVDDDESIDLADVMVAATGDPRYTEKAELDQEFKRLTRLQAAHVREQQAARLLITEIDQRLPKQRQAIERAEQDTARYVSTRGNAFTMTVQGDTVTKRTAAAERLTAALLHEFSATPRTRDGRDLSICTLGGFNITAQLRPMSQNSTIHLVVAEAGSYTALALGHRELPDGHGLITRLENLLAEIPKRPDRLRAQLADSEETLNQARQQLDVPFPHATRLAEATARRMELTAELAEEDDDDTTVVVDPDSPAGRARAERLQRRAKQRAELAEQVRQEVFEAGGQDPHDFATWYVAIVEGIAVQQRPPILTAHKVWVELGRPHARIHMGTDDTDTADEVAATNDAVGDSRSDAAQPIEVAPELAWLADAAMVSTVVNQWATVDTAVAHLRRVEPLPFYGNRGLLNAWQADLTTLLEEIAASRKTQLSPSGALIAYKAKPAETDRLAWYVVHTASGAQIGNLLTKTPFDETVLDRGPAITLPDAMIPRYLYALEHCADTEGRRLDWTQAFAGLRNALGSWTTTLSVDTFGRLRGADLPAEVIGLRSLHSRAVLDATKPDPLAAALTGELTILRRWVAPAISDTRDERSVAPLGRALASAFRDRYPRNPGENKTLRAVDEDTARVLTCTALWGFGADPAFAIRLLNNRIAELQQLHDLEPTLPVGRLHELVLHLAELHTTEPTELERLLRATPGCRLIAAPADSLALQPDHTWEITGPPDPIDATPGGHAARLPVTLHHENGLAHGTLTIDTAAAEPVVITYGPDQPDARDLPIPTPRRLPALAAGSWMVVDPGQAPPTTLDELRRQSHRAARTYLDQANSAAPDLLPLTATSEPATTADHNTTPSRSTVDDGKTPVTGEPDQTEPHDIDASRILTAPAATTDAPAPDNPAHPAELVDLGEFPGAWFSEDLGFAPRPLTDTDRAWIEQWLTRLAQLPEAHLAARTRGLEAFFDEFRRLASVAMLAAGENPDPAARPSKAVEDWFFGDQRSPAVLLVDAATQLHAAVHRGTDQPVAPTQPPATPPAAGPQTRDSARNADDFGTTPPGTEPPDPADIRAVAPPEPAPSAPASPQPGPWSTRIRVDLTPSGLVVSGTRKTDPQILRDTLKANRIWWDNKEGVWRHRGRTADRPAAAQAVRDVLSELDAQAAQEQAAPAYPPTAQQQAIIDAVVAGQDVAVLALAGTGKTSTLRMLARALPDRRIVYIAFNRTTADEAQRSFPAHVTADTMHAFARQGLRDGPHGRLLDKLNNGGARLSKDVAPVLGIRRAVVLGGQAYEPETLARLAMDAVGKFRNSADDQLTGQHLPDGVADNPQLAQFVLDRAELAWSDVLSPAGQLVFTHDDYLKLWALTKPRLGANVIFFDEAQDINDVQRQVIVDQRIRTDGGRGTQIIVVGDSYQSIYGFRGAKDALQTWPADVRLPLTQSWRFGPAVAQLGNQFLALLNASMELEGNPALRSRVEQVPRPDAILCRTNAGAVTAVFEAFDAGRRVALVGGGEAIEDIAKAAQALQRNRRTRHPDLAGFASWSDVREAANTEPAAKHLQPFVRLVDKHGAQRLIDMARDLVAEDDPDADKVIVSTAHKAKGLEWDRVRIADDFRGPTEDGENGVVLPGLEEIRLSYVAVTRAKASIELGSLAWIRDYVPDDHTASSKPSIVDTVVTPQQRDDTPTPIAEPPADSAPDLAADAGEGALVAAFGVTDAHPAVAEVRAAVALLPASADPARAALDRHRLAAAALDRYVITPRGGGIQPELAAIADRHAHSAALLLPRSLELRPAVEWPHWVLALRQCATVLAVAGGLDDFAAAIGQVADVIEGRIVQLADHPAEVIADTGMAAIRLVPADHPAAPELGRQLRRAQRDHRVTGEDYDTGGTLRWACDLLEDPGLIPDEVADRDVRVGWAHRRWGAVAELRALADHVEAAGYTTPLQGRSMSAPDLWRQLADATAARLVSAKPNDVVIHKVPDTVPHTVEPLEPLFKGTPGQVERLAAALADGSDNAENGTNANLAASSIQETPLRAFQGLRTADPTRVASAAAALQAGNRADALFHLSWALPDDPSVIARGSTDAWEMLDLLLRNTDPAAVDLAELDRLSRYPITYFDDSPPLIAAHLVGLTGALLAYADHVNDDLGRVLATLPIHFYAFHLDTIAAQIAQRYHFPLPTDQARLRPDQVVEALAAEAEQAAVRTPVRDAKQPDTATEADPDASTQPNDGPVAEPPPRDPHALFEHAVALAQVAHAETAAAGGHNPNAWLAFSEVVRTDPHTGIAYAAVQPQWEDVSQWWYGQASAALAELGYTVEARGRDDGRRGWRDHQIEVDTGARVVIVDARQVVGTTAHNLVACVAELRDVAAGDPVHAEQRQVAPVAGATAEHPEDAGIVSGQANLFDQPAEVAAPATASGGVAAEDSNSDEAAELDEIYAAEGYPLIDDLTGVTDLFAAHHWVLVDEQPNELGATQHWRRHDASLAVTVTPHDRVLMFIATLHGPMESDTWVEGEVASAADLRSLIEQDGLHGVARPARLPGLWRVTAAEDPDTAVAAAEPDLAARLVARPADADTGDSWTFVDDGTPVPLAPPLPDVPVTNRAELHRYVLGEHQGDRQLRELASIILGHRSRGGVTPAMACEQLANANPHVYHRAVAGSVGYVRGAPFGFDRARLALERLAEGDPALPLNSLGQYVELTESVPAGDGNPTGDEAATQPVRGVVVDIRPDSIRVRVIIQRDEPSSAGAEQVAADFPIDGRVVVLDPATRPTAGAPVGTAAAQSDRPALTTPPDTGEPEQLAHQEPDAATDAAGADDNSRLQPAEADAEVLVIEHSHAGTRVLGTDRDDTDLHRVLGRHGFKFSRQQEFWYLSRQQRYDTRSWRVRELAADLDRLGRPYLLGEEEPEAAAEAAPAPLPDLPPYTDRGELLEDRRQVRAAYHEATTATAAARRMLSLGEGRSDAAALYQAWRAVAHDDNTSGPDDLADRYAQLYRAARALCDNLVAERKRAPVLMGHLADLVTHGERFAARLHATAEAAGVVGQHLTPTVAETVHSDLSAQTTQGEVAELLTLDLGGQDTDAPTPAEASSAGPVGMPAVALDEDEFRAASPAEGALAWWDAGCSVVPVRADGSKAPAGQSWVQYQTQRATRERVTAWFAGGHPGMGVVCGAVSGDLEMFEFEGRAVDEGLVDRLRDQLTSSGHGDLWQTVISGYVERSPSGGLHVMFRVEGGVDRNSKLAQREARDDELTDDEQVLLRDKGIRARRVLIETRGEGGFVVVAPSQGPVHDSGQPWLALTGTPATIPTLTAEQRNTVHLAARALDQVPPQAPAPEPAPDRARATSGDGVLPGDDFNERAEWAYILSPHGWEVERVQANRTYWRRPGKDRGISAVTGGDRGNHMWVWSTSTELPSDRAMSKFHVYALLEHGGDFSAAARALRTAGYGRPSTTAPTRLRPAAGAARRPRPADPGPTSTTQPSTSDTSTPDGPHLQGQVSPVDATAITVHYGLASADDAVRYLLARQNWQHLGWADLVTVAEGEDHELHIATTSRTQIREATARLWPVVCHYGLGFAAALDPETLTESGRFGIIVQLPRGETLDRDTTAVVAALDGYHGHPRAAPDGLHVAGSVWYRRANQPAADQPNPPGDPVEKSDQATIGASGPDATDTADAEPRTSGPNNDGNATDAPHEDSVSLRRPSARALLAGLDPDVVRADTAGRYPTSPRDATIEHLWRDLRLAEHLDLDSDALRLMCDVIIGLRRGHDDDLDARARYEVANGRGLPTATALVALADEFTERCAGTDALGEALRAVGLDALPEALRTVANRMAVSGEFQVLGGPDGRIRQTSLFEDSPAEPEPASPATTRHVPATGGAPAQPSAQTSPDLDARPVTVTLAEALGRAGQGVDLDAARVDAERQIAGELQRLRAPDLAAVAAVAGQAEAEQVRTRVALSEQRERFLTNAVALFGLAGDEHYRADGRVVDPLQVDQILAVQARAAQHSEDGQPSVLTWRGLRITFRPAPPGPDYAPVVTVVLDALGELDTTAGLSADMLLGGNEHQVREAVEYPVSAQRPARIAAAERLNITHDHARLAGERAAGPDTAAAGAVPVRDPDRDPPHADDKPTLRLPDGRELVHIPDPQAAGPDHFGLAVEAYLLEEPGRFRLVVGRNAAHVAHHQGDRPWWWAIQRIDSAGKQIGAGIAPRSAMYGTAQTALRAAAARLVPLQHQLPTAPADPAQQAAGPNGHTTAPTTPTPAPAAASVPAVASSTEDDGVDIRPAPAPAGGGVSALSTTVFALRTRLAAAGVRWPSRLDAFLLASDPFDAAHELRMITAEAPTEPRVQMLAAMAWRCQHGRVTAERAQAFADRLAAADPGLASAAAGRDVRDPRTGHMLHQVTMRADIDGRLILIDTATAGPAAPRCAVDPDMWLDPAGVEILAAADASALLTRWQDLSEQARTLGYTVRDRRGMPSALHPGERLMVIGEDSLAGRVEALTGQLQRVQPQPTPPAVPPPGPPAPESAKGAAVAAAPEEPRRATPHRTVVDAITLIPATDPTAVPLDEQLSFAGLAGMLQRDEPGRLALTYVLQLVRSPDQDPQALARTVLNVAHRREEATAVADRLDGLAAKLDAAGYTADTPPIPQQLLLISQHVRAALGTGPAPAGPPPAALDRPATPRPAPPPPPHVATAPAATPPPEEARPHADPAPLRPAGRPPAAAPEAAQPQTATAARTIEWPAPDLDDERDDDPDPSARWVALVEQAGRVGYRVNTTFADTCEIDTTNQILMVSAAHGPEQRLLDLEHLLSVITAGGEPTHSSPTAPRPSRTATPAAPPAPTAVPPAPAARRMVASRPAERRPLPASVTPIFDDVLRKLGWADRTDLLGHDHPRRVASIPAQPQPIPESATPVFDQLMRELGWTDHLGGDAAEPPLPRPAAPAVAASAALPSTTAGRATALLVPTTTATTRPASTTGAFALGRWDTTTTTPRGRSCP